MRSLFLVLAQLAQIVSAVSLWDTTGPYQVGYTQHVFNHTTPNDPTPNPGILLLQSTIPRPSARVYEQWVGLTNGSLSRLTTHLQPQAPTLLGTHPAFGNGTSPYPTLIFTPGAGGAIFGYTAQLSELASWGFAVVGIDHPGEAPYTALPYGAAGVEGLPTLVGASAAAIRQIYDYRISDVAAVMSAPFLPSLIARYGAPFNTTHYAVFGHSIGGAGAAGIMIDCPDLFRAGVNMDGTFQHLTRSNADSTANVPDPDAVSPDLRAPFLELASERFQGMEDAGGGPENDTTWAHFNANQTGWLRDVQVNGAAHLDYMDIPLWVDLLGERGSPAAALLGSIEGKRVTEVVTGLLLRFFWEWVGGGEGLESVDGFIARTPEAFVMASK